MVATSFGFAISRQDRDDYGYVGGDGCRVTKSLYVMRHAKSSWKDPDLPDFERPLNRRGQRDARRMARRLAGTHPLPELVLCSSATRATQTCEPIARLLGSSVEVRFEDELYCASRGALLTRLRSVPDDVGSVLLIGHNPGVQDLLVELAGDGDPDHLDQVRAGFPTGAVATLRVGSRWSELGPFTASVQDLLTPSTLSD